MTKIGPTDACAAVRDRNVKLHVIKLCSMCLYEQNRKTFRSIYRVILRQTYINLLEEIIIKAILID